MRITFLLNLLCLVAFSSSSYSQNQNFTINIENARVKEIFKTIENQSSYRFFYNDQLSDINRVVNFSVKNSNIQELLSQLFDNTDIICTVLENNLIVVAPKRTLQQKKLTGTITDATNGEPLIGVNIVVEGSTIGVISDANGKFSIDVPGNTSILIFSYIGYLQEKVAFSGQSTLNVQLVPDVKQLDEIVVVGYGTMKRSDVTGAVSSIKSADISSVKSSNAVEALQGKIAGLDITQSSGQAGAGFNVLLRGARSLSGSNNPIYIVDGIEYGSNIDISPNDIASMDVLKDASATAIYGSKGANGVILITTKKGTKGKMTVSFDTYYGYTTPLGKLNNGDSNYFLKEARDMYRLNNNNWNLTDDEIDLNTAILSNNEKIGYNNGTNFDWVKAQRLDHGSQQNYHLTVAGGTEKTQYSVSVDHFIQNNSVPNDYLKRYSIKANIDTKVNNVFEMGNSTLISFSQNRQGNGVSYSMNPLTQPYDTTGGGNKLTILPDDRVPFLNPVIDIDPNNTIDEVYNTKIFSTFYLQFNLMKGLTFKSAINLNMAFNREGTYQRELKQDTTKLRVSTGSLTQQSNYKYTLTNILAYNKDFSKHHIQLTGGSETMYARTERQYESGQNLNLKDSWWYTLNSATQNVTITDPSGYPLTEESMVSFFGRLNYGFDGKYLATFTGRYDGSSRLRNKWDFFPSASVAWRISQEDFLKSVSAISNLKIRFGYGISGNQSATIYSSFGGINATPLTYEFGQPEKVLLGYRTSKVENPYLSWEKTATTNLGLDFGLLADRINGSIELYQSHTKDILQSRSLPPTSAVPSVFQNVRETKGKGIEFTLRTVNISTKDFSWTTDFTFAANKEEITYLVGGVQKDEANKWFVGSPLIVYYDMKKIGIWQTEEAAEAAKSGKTPGDIKFQDQNGNDTIKLAEDRTVLGSPRPKWTAGINSTVSYKGFDFSVFVNARVGQMLQDVAESYWSPDLRENSIVRDYWTPNNPTNAYPRLNPGLTRSGWSDGAALQYVDGSFVKIKDITLGYTLPKSLTTKAYISSLRIYVNAKNYFVFGAYSSKGRFDPEGVNSGGVTNTNYPNPKMITIGANVTF